MRSMQRLLICTLCLASSLAAQTWRVDSTRLNALAQDSTGQVWGIGAFMSSSLYRWEGDKWVSVPVSGISDNFRPYALTAGPDGAVYCLWSAGYEAHIVTWHKGNDLKTLAQFSGDLSNSSYIFIDPNKNVWITERGIHIYRITPEGKAECVYTIEYDHRYEANLPKGGRLNSNAVHATADGQGRIWFWSGGPAEGGGVPSLDGILIYDGRKFDLHSEFPGPPIKRYFVMEPDGADHMWLAGVADHLYRIDIKTLIAEVVPQPGPHLFRSVQRIFPVGRATYLVSADGSIPVPERSGEGRIGALWRLQDGEWKRMVNGLDMRPEMGNDPPRPFLATPAGIWIGAYGTGPWFIPAGSGEPVHIDWRYGYSLDGSEGLMILADARLLLVATTNGNETYGSTAIVPPELLASSQSPAEVRTLNPLRVLVPDQHGHVWGFLSADKVISEWDGKAWIDHPLPGSFDPVRSGSFGVDSQDRIWLLTGCQGSVSIFYPRQGTSETYFDFSAALQAQLPSSASIRIEGNRIPVPTFTPDGQIGYRDECGQAHYFNGRTWQAWRPQDIDTGRHEGFDGPAFFDRAGNFAVDIAGSTWDFTQAEGWRITSYERGLGTDQERRYPHATPPPPGCDFNNPDSVVQDRLGTYWLTSRDQLYRALPGLCVAQFSPGQRQPFVDSRTIRKVVIDPQGNAFLETAFRAHPEIEEYVIVNARPPLPKTTMQASVEASGIVKLHFETQVKCKVWFTWRVDGGEWTHPTASADTTVNWLPNGKHRIEAAALDERLQIDPTPGVAEVEIHVDRREQVLELIKKLNDPDYSVRDAAVAALVRQPALALPLLQSAREKADPDRRWWIDAAIQQIHVHPPKDRQP
jgi:streptogramin lyase